MSGKDVGGEAMRVCGRGGQVRGARGGEGGVERGGRHGGCC